MRYHRHKILLGDLDDKIHKLKVAVIGLGGIGSFLSELLARAGVKKLILIDKSTVDLSDLHRQLYSEKDIGKLKVKATLDRLKNVNSEVEYEVHYDFNKENAEEIFKKADIIFDATDNLETRYLINEVSVKLRKPWIFGTVLRFEGYSCLINPQYFCFNCIFPDKITNETSGDVGVFSGAVLFVVSLQLKLLLDFLEKGYEPYLYYFNLRKPSLEKIKIKRQKNCKICVKGEFKYIK